MLGSPVLLLAAAITLTVIGLVANSEGVATIGAIGIVAALVLPRMKGPLEIGPSGVKGGTVDEFFDYAWRQGVESGLDPDEAREVARAAREVALNAVSPARPCRVALARRRRTPGTSRGRNRSKTVPVLSVRDDLQTLR